MPLEVLRAMREAGAVKALAQALNLVSTEHPQVSGGLILLLLLRLWQATQLEAAGAVFVCLLAAGNAIS
jgi:hypothetical protein